MVCDRCNYFSFWAISCPFTPNCPKNQNFEKMKKTPGNIIILHKFTKSYDKDEVQFLRYAVRQTDRRTEKITYRGGCPTWKYDLNSIAYCVISPLFKNRNPQHVVKKLNKEKKWMGPKWTFATNNKFFWKTMNMNFSNFMVPFYGWGSTVSRLHSHYKETVYFLPLGPKEVLELIWFTWEGWKVDSTLKTPSGFEPGIPHLNP